MRGFFFEPFKTGDRAQTRLRVQSLTKTDAPRVKHVGFTHITDESRTKKILCAIHA